MAISFLDVCRFNPSASGTADFLVSGAVTGYLTPSSAGAVNGAIYRYRAESADLSQWEVGYGAYNTGTSTLARTTVIFSTNSNAKVSFTTAPQVAIVALAEDLTFAGGLSSITASLGADVSLTSTGSFFDGPSVAQGTTGTWFASGTVTLEDTGGAALFICKLWDGTNVIAAAEMNSGGATGFIAVSLSGVMTSPAGNIRISVRDNTSTSGLIKFNVTGTSKDSTVTAVRIA